MQADTMYEQAMVLDSTNLVPIVSRTGLWVNLLDHLFKMWDTYPRYDKDRKSQLFAEFFEIRCVARPGLFLATVAGTGCVVCLMVLTQSPWFCHQQLCTLHCPHPVA